LLLLGDGAGKLTIRRIPSIEQSLGRGFGRLDLRVERGLLRFASSTRFACSARAVV
jgi:hypothetical protein